MTVVFPVTARLPLRFRENALIVPLKEGLAGIARQNYVGDLPGGDLRTGDFDFIVARSGVEKIVAHAVGGGGIGESLGEGGVRENLREWSAGLAGGGHCADADGSSGERDAARVENDVVFAGALRTSGRNCAG